MANQKKPLTKKQLRAKRRKRKIRLFFTAVILLAVLLGGVYFASLYNKIKHEKFDKADAGINGDLASDTLKTMEGYTNIALFGLDNRSSGNYKTGNSDTIMIASINNETKEVKLVSVFRDTLLNVGDDTYKKCNHAFSNGGAAKAVAMINSNLDLDITEYICVDWAALVKVIDDLGGLDLTLTSEEVSLLNTYLLDVDLVTGKKTSYLSGSGEMHLDGTQALCYARIRKTAGDDFLRTSRQRIVLQAMVEKAKKASPATLVEICNDTFGDISTTLDLGEMIDLAKDVTSYNMAETTGFPFYVNTKNISGSGDCVVPCTLTDNVSELHEFLFGETGYIPSASVQGFSNKIANQSGYKSKDDAFDISRYNDTTGATGTYFKDNQ